MHPMLNVAIQAARNAGRIIVRFLDDAVSYDLSVKSRNDFVTEVDLRSEQEIINTIRKSYPNHSILAEESGHTDGNEFCWIIDPLDGTTNFVHGFPHFAVSIALKRKDQLEVACIYDPIRQELFTATRGGGAQLNNRRLRVSNCKKLEDALIGTGFPFKEHHHFKPFINIFSALFPQTAGIRRAGSAALDLAYVAAGRLDGFWEAALKEWDTAAGILMIKEAGGLVSDFHGKDNYFDTGNVVTGNAKVYKAMFDIIEESIKQGV